MSKYSKLNYSQCVDRGLSLVEDYNNFKYDLCELCLRVCEIKGDWHEKRKGY